MKWATAIAEEKDLEQAVAAAGEELSTRLGTEQPDLLVAFAAGYGSSARARLGDLLGRTLPARVRLGCSAGGVIGGGREVEGSAALSLMGAVLPDVRLVPLSLRPGAMPRDAAGWRELVGIAAEERPAFVLLGEPFSCDAQALAEGLDGAYPGAVKVGGLASGGRTRGAHTLWLGESMQTDGAVGVACAGAMTVDTIVAQGCRPIGQPMFVTAAEGGVLRALNGRPVLEVLRELYESLEERDRALMQHALFFGVVMDETRQEYQLGDFLVRHVVGMLPEKEGVIVGGELRQYQVVQFHLRDASTSSEELVALLRRYREAPDRPQPVGALLFSCLGRGIGLYGVPDHDSRRFQEAFGDVPLGGFFGNGEIGPVGGRTYLHGYTSAFGLFSPR
ncbi:MAG TPA: FIST N-terminal domain-containing protein [Polyangia bacterium]|nr:FIST N-terminal domain-containing protein [Polyangia bacterium]